MSGLDPIGRHAMRELIRALHARGTTIIFSSHILPDAEALCDRVAILTRRTPARGDRPARRHRAPRLPAHRERRRPADTLAALERLAVRRRRRNGTGWRVRLPGSTAVGPALDLVRGAAGTVESLVPVHPSLEERFLAHVGPRPLSTEQER